MVAIAVDFIDVVVLVLVFCFKSLILMFDICCCLLIDIQAHLLKQRLKIARRWLSKSSDGLHDGMNIYVCSCFCDFVSWNQLSLLLRSACIINVRMYTLVIDGLTMLLNLIVMSLEVWFCIFGLHLFVFVFLGLDDTV